MSIRESTDPESLRADMLALPWRKCRVCGMPLLAGNDLTCPHAVYDDFLACLRRAGRTMDTAEKSVVNIDVSDYTPREQQDLLRRWKAALRAQVVRA